MLIPILLLLAAAPGCAGTTSNIDWASPVSKGVAQGDAGEIQQALDTYAAALVSKDRDRFLSVIDQENPEFRSSQARIFDRLAATPFARYQIKATSQKEEAPGRLIVRVEAACTYRDSFAGLPNSDRFAFSLVRREGGWKISGDATEQALGKSRDAGLEDFGPVQALVGSRVIVLYLPSQSLTARQVAQLAEAAFPRLETAIPGVQLPKIPVRIFDNKEQIDKVFPGKWTEWTGGASRQLGGSADQGGEIIIDAQTFNDMNRVSPGYNSRMLAHELTHIALFPVSDSRTPPFLIEGLADYVAGSEDVSLLKHKLRSGQSFSPTLKDLCQSSGFSAILSTDAATLAYEQSDTAVALLEKRYGNDKVLQLIKEFQRRSTEENDQHRLVDAIFRDVLGVGWEEFEGQWQRYVTTNY